MRFRVRTIMIAIVIVGLVMALVVLWRRAAEDLYRTQIELQGTRIVNAELRMAMDVAQDRARSAEQRAIAAEARANAAELRAKEALQQSSRVDGDPGMIHKPPTQAPSVAQ
jgi:hypothetical protein